MNMAVGHGLRLIRLRDPLREKERERERERDYHNVLEKIIYQQLVYVYILWHTYIVYSLYI